MQSSTVSSPRRSRHHLARAAEPADRPVAEGEEDARIAIEILDSAGVVIRTLEAEDLPKEKGLNRAAWDLAADPPFARWAVRLTHRSPAGLPRGAGGRVPRADRRRQHLLRRAGVGAQRRTHGGRHPAPRGAAGRAGGLTREEPSRDQPAVRRPTVATCGATNSSRTARRRRAGGSRPWARMKSW